MGWLTKKMLSDRFCKYSCNNYYIVQFKMTCVLNSLLPEPVLFQACCQHGIDVPCCNSLDYNCIVNKHKTLYNINNTKKNMLDTGSNMLKILPIFIFCLMIENLEMLLVEVQLYRCASFFSFLLFVFPIISFF